MDKTLSKVSFFLFIHPISARLSFIKQTALNMLVKHMDKKVSGEDGAVTYLQNTEAIET